MMRSLKHLCSGDWQLRRAFPLQALSNIEAAIQQSELTHQGEIRFAVEAGLDIGPLLKNQTARDRALQVFSELRVWDTELNNGVLVYLLLADRDIEIIADRGLNAKMAQVSWDSICREMRRMFLDGKFEEGVITGIRAISQELAKLYPKRPRDINELPDRPTVL